MCGVCVVCVVWCVLCVLCVCVRRAYATSVCGLKLLVYEALSYLKALRPVKMPDGSEVNRLLAS